MGAFKFQRRPNGEAGGEFRRDSVADRSNSRGFGRRDHRTPETDQTIERRESLFLHRDISLILKRLLLVDNTCEILEFFFDPAAFFISFCRRERYIEWEIS